MSVFAVIMDQCLQSVFLKRSVRLDGNLLNYLVILYTNLIIYKDFSKNSQIRKDVFIIFFRLITVYFTQE